jgi:hypothetical protein
MTVARAGSDWQLGLTQEDFETPARMLPAIELEVAPDERMGDVIDRAAKAHEMELPNDTAWGAIYSIAFSRGPESTVFGRISSEVALVELDGKVRWTPWWQLEPVSEFVRASEAGVLDGNPLEPILLVHPPMGNGVLADFPGLLEAWDVIWSLLEHLDTLGGAYAAKKLVVDRLRNRYRRGRDAAEPHVEQWERRGGRPDNLVRWLKDVPQTTEAASKALGVTDDEAQAVLEALGFALDTEGVWRFGLDSESSLNAGNATIVIHAPDLVREELEAIVEERVQALIEKDEVPVDPDWERLGSAPRDPDYRYERRQLENYEDRVKELGEITEQARRDLAD